MKIDYDKTADAVYIRIKPGVVKKTTKLSHLANIDLDKSGRVLGVEILKASLKFSNKQKFQSVINVPLSVSA